MSAGYRLASLDEIEPVDHRGSNLLAVRHTLGVRAFGINAWQADTGGQLVPPHEENSGNEEVYLVVRGRATFTLGEEDVDAPAGTLLFLEAGVHRTAVAAEPGTIVLAVGASVGEPFAGGHWDTFAVADAHRRAGRLDEGLAVMREAIDESPPSWGTVYNTACLEALGGRPDDAIAHLRQALALNEEEVRKYLVADGDLDPIRDDPRFQELLG